MVDSVKSLSPHNSTESPVGLAAGATHNSLVASASKNDALPTSWRFLNVDDNEASFGSFADGGFMFNNFG